MALFKGKGPGKRGGRWWDVIKLEPGGKWKGWVAGPVVGVDTHFCGASRPCHDAFTDGALKCPMCEMELPLVFKAYVPLWSQSGTRSLLITGDRYWDSMQLLQHLQPVVVSMGSTRGHPYCCGASTWTALRPVLAQPDQKEQDITPHLLQMWRDETISAWVQKHPAGSDNAVSLAPLAPIAKPVSPRPVRAGRDAPTRAEPDMPAAGDALDAAMRRCRARAKAVTPEPPTNGVHKKTVPPKG